MNSPAIMARRSYLRARCNLVIARFILTALDGESTNISGYIDWLRQYGYAIFLYDVRNLENAIAIICTIPNR